jgi:hypothetical protein
VDQPAWVCVGSVRRVAAERAFGRVPATAGWVEWHDDLPGNRLDRVHALTALTPMPWWEVLYLKVKFTKTKVWPNPEIRNLREHEFVHFGRWTFVRPPRGTGKLGDRYVLIETNYNGSFAEYLDTIATDLKKHMNKIWGGCYGCPENMQPTTEFRRWARDHEAPAQHYFCPYPDATVKEIEVALALRRDLEELVKGADERGGDRAVEKLAGEIDRLLVRLERTTAPESKIGWGRRIANALRALWWPDRFGRVSALTIRTPISPSRLEALENHLARLGPSPFSQVPGTHFARWVVVKQLRNEGNRFRSSNPLDAHPPMLLFGAAVDGTPDRYLDVLCAQLPAEGCAVWTDHCEGLDQSGALDRIALKRYLKSKRVRGGLFYAGYEASATEVVEAVQARRRLREYGLWRQGRDSARCVAEFRRRFARASGAARAWP